jgi:hypothetical protein
VKSEVSIWLSPSHFHHGPGGACGKRLDRILELAENKKDRRVSLWVASIALLGVVLSTGGAVLGAKWGSGATLEADRQERIHDLCVEAGERVQIRHRYKGPDRHCSGNH